MSLNLVKSIDLYKAACRHIPGGVNSPVRAFRQVGGTPVFFRSASGSTVTDVDGNKYIDYCQSWGPLILGHSRSEVVEAVRTASARGLSYGACHTAEITLAELILEAFPGFQRVRMVNSGTEAVMTALRIARGVTGRNYTLKFEGGYHGHFDGMLVKAGSGLATHAIASSAGVPESIASTTLAAPLDDEQAVEKIFDRFGSQIASVIIEPLPANNGLLPQRNDFLAFLREITSRYGAKLIFDEVISGFRVRYGGYWESTGVKPDIITLGKVIGGGMPVGAVLGSSADMDQLSPLGNIYQAGTLSGNPVSLAAGIATLEILRSEQPYSQLDNLGRVFCDVLSESPLPYVRAQRVGSVVWLYLDTGEFPRRADAISTTAMERFTRMYHVLLESGFYLPPSSFEVMFISTAHSEADVQKLALAVRNVLENAG